MKKAFTLIEVMISIVIFSILVLFMSKVVSSLNISLHSLDKTYQKNQKQNLLIKTLYADILNSKHIIIDNKNKNYSILFIQTSNSLYDIAMPYIVWYVSKKDKALMRLESSKEIHLPMDSGNLDLFDKNVKIFKVYKNNNKYFIFIKGKKELFFEILK